MNIATYNYLYLLPVELQTAILSHLSDKDLVTACLTCKHWNDICTSDILWKKRVIDALLLCRDELDALSRLRQQNQALTWKQIFCRFMENRFSVYRMHASYIYTIYTHTYTYTLLYYLHIYIQNRMKISGKRRIAEQDSPGWTSIQLHKQIPENGIQKAKFVIRSESRRKDSFGVGVAVSSKSICRSDISSCGNGFFNDGTWFCNLRKGVSTERYSTNGRSEDDVWTVDDVCEITVDTIRCCITYKINGKPPVMPPPFTYAYVSIMCSI